MSLPKERLVGLPDGLTVTHRARLAVAGVYLAVLAAWAAGRVRPGLFQFPPPLEILSGYRPFSWVAAAAVVLSLVALFLPWLRSRRSLLAENENVPGPASATGSFPAWVGLALAWTLAWWALAWTRGDGFASLQRYTFFPLWLGFIVTLNALAQALSGSCLMLRTPRRWLKLFGASAVCWWAFEWLNRFVRNWHYLGVEDFGPLAYAVHATLCFSTVLPALAGAAEVLDALPCWRRIASCGPGWPWLGQPATRLVFALAGVAALLGAGAWPNWFYPALWVAPLALLLALPRDTGGSQLSSEIAAGDWRRAATWMAAGIGCGFFWELWNWQSVAKWIYTVPGVERWHLFEMPALGYSGYLPFGLECLLVAERVIGDEWRQPDGGWGSGRQ